MALVSIFNFDDLSSLNRFLRKEQVDLFVKLGSAISGVICIASLAFLIYQLVALQLSSSKAIANMRLQIQTALDTVAVQVEAPKVQVDHSSISEKSLFGLVVEQEVSPIPTIPPVSNLELSLIGTFIQSGQPAYAIIEDTKKQQQEVFNTGDSVFDSAKLVRIMHDRVEIERDGRIEILRLDDVPDSPNGAKVSSAGAQDFTIPEQEVETALNNLPLLMTQARAVPYFRDGKAVGLRMFAIRPGSIYEKIGLQNGDILKSINGNDMGDMTQALKLFETLKSERSISLTLERAQETKTFNYQIR